MNRIWKLLSVLAVCLLAVQLATPAALAEGDPEARKARILANLKLKFPQLESTAVSMGTIGPSGIAGLDEGSFVVGGRQTQNFLVTQDDTKLYLVAGEPIDVSKGQEEIEEELAARRAKEAEEAKARMAELEQSIEGLPFRGNADAKVTIIEFSDFQCPYCSRGAETMEQVLAKYPDQVKFVFKHFPLDFHKWAKPASIAAYCAGQQDNEAFWTLHDMYFEKQRELTPENVVAKSRESLAGSDVDMGVWADCAENTGTEAYQAASAAVDADMAFGQKMGVSGTPGFFVNGTFLSGAQPISKFDPIIQEVLSGSAGGR